MFRVDSAMARSNEKKLRDILINIANLRNDKRFSYDEIASFIPRWNEKSVRDEMMQFERWGWGKRLTINDRYAVFVIA